METRLSANAAGAASLNNPVAGQAQVEAGANLTLLSGVNTRSPGARIAIEGAVGTEGLSGKAQVLGFTGPLVTSTKPLTAARALAKITGGTDGKVSAQVGAAIGTGGDDASTVLGLGAAGTRIGNHKGLTFAAALTAGGELDTVTGDIAGTVQAQGTAQYLLGDRSWAVNPYARLDLKAGVTGTTVDNLQTIAGAKASLGITVEF